VFRLASIVGGLALAIVAVVRVVTVAPVARDLADQPVSGDTFHTSFPIGTGNIGEKARAGDYGVFAVFDDLGWNMAAAFCLLGMGLYLQEPKGPREQTENKLLSVFAICFMIVAGAMTAISTGFLLVGTEEEDDVEYGYDEKVAAGSLGPVMLAGIVGGSVLVILRQLCCNDN